MALVAQALLVLACMAAAATAPLTVTPAMKTFGDALKGGSLTRGQLRTVFSYSAEGGGCITEQWFTGQVRVRVRLLSAFPEHPLSISSPHSPTPTSHTCHATTT
eukprot:COSAG04_NODE_14256_length_575_cov_1.176471_2_plen_103_part_01